MQKILTYINDSKGYMLDTTYFNDLLDTKNNLEQLPDGHFFVTHVQVDQINKTSDQKRKQQLLQIFRLTDADEVPTESFVLDYSRLNKAKLGDGIILEELRKNNLKHTEDALIAETAIKNGFVLITSDKQLYEKVRTLDGKTIFYGKPGIKK